MSAALHSIVRLMAFNSKVEQTESRTASWNGLCSTFEGPLYFVIPLKQTEQIFETCLLLLFLLNAAEQRSVTKFPVHVWMCDFAWPSGN
jgi:hypothetical protein